MVSVATETGRREPVVSSPVLGMILFILTEIMIFASFISAFTIVKSGFTNWPPVGQPRLPVEMTAVNTVFLLVSGVLLHASYKSFLKEEAPRSRKLYLGAMILGLLFVLIQGVEWARLIGYGLTLTSSQYGSFFYLIVGGHALHVLAAAGALGIMFCRLTRGNLKKESFAAVDLFWIFVVALWPVLYSLVYL